MPRRPLTNRLNELSPKEWLKFQKSWFVHNPPPRQKDVLRHPAKFPESLAQDFIAFFTKPGQAVLDPMAGTGSTLIAALRLGRNSYGLELNPAYTEIAQEQLLLERERLGIGTGGLQSLILSGDAGHLAEIADLHQFPPIDYVLTSPPYWDMLHSRGAATQKTRRASEHLDVVYSDDPADLGNITNYDDFLARLVKIYVDMSPLLRQRAYLTIIVKNVKKGGTIYPLAWDLARKLNGVYILKDEKIWCQDNQRLSPYGLGNAWVSNTFHHYCLQFRKD